MRSLPVAGKPSPLCQLARQPVGLVYITYIVRTLHRPGRAPEKHSPMSGHGYRENGALRASNKVSAPHRQTQPPEDQDGYLDHCRTIVLDCQRCVRDYEKAADDRQTGQKDAVVAVVFSVAALEAFMNEATAFATGSPRQIGKPSSVRAFADIMQELEESQSRPESQVSIRKGHICRRTLR